ncbi:MAG TPA: hypothetical protein VE569_08920 [Acidimicrobiia bacterium]|jgi:hypothetical protein|nr:hypothetical protein [Acidimicrobiia bacterium]
MSRWTTWLIAFTLALVSCVGGSVKESATTTASVTDPGRLVILDGKGDVVVLDPDGSNRVSITDDAGESAAYTQPIWSPDTAGLAFGQVTSDGFSVGLYDLTEDTTTTITTSNLPFYMFFSPDGARLGILHNGTAGVDFNLVDVASGTIEMIDSGVPFYFSWSPDEDLLVTHVGADRVETIDSEGERVALKPTSPLYLAPQWTDRGVFHVVDDSLVVEDEDGARVRVAGVSGPTMFVANHQGTRVAVQTTGQGGGVIEAALADPPTLPSNRVVVVDVTNGSTGTVSDHLALGFFWSPDGRKLLTLVPANNQVIPRVWAADGSSTDYPGYLPPNTMLQDTFPFFPQYAQSVSFWAPDSSSFAYAGAVEGEAGIWVQTLHNDTPQKVSEGRWVAWSR